MISGAGGRFFGHRVACYTDDMTSSNDESRPVPSDDEPGDPAAIADDGMAPLINNTGADDTADDDADASSG